MKYTQKSFSVASPGTREYADNWERTFRGITVPEETSAVLSSPMYNITMPAKACPVCGSYEHQQHEPEHKP